MQAQQYFRTKDMAYPWAIAAVVLFGGAYMLAIYNQAGWAILAFAAGLMVAGLGLNLIRQPAARLTAGTLTLTDARGISLASRSYAVDNVKRITVVTRNRSIPNRMRRGVLMVNMTGVPAERIADFARELEQRNVPVDY